MKKLTGTVLGRKWNSCERLTDIKEKDVEAIQIWDGYYHPKNYSWTFSCRESSKYDNKNSRYKLSKGLPLKM